MKLKYIKSSFFLIIIFLQQNAHSQDYRNYNYRIGLTSGIGFYIQDDLKQINQDVKEQLVFKAETIDNFPPNLFFGGYFLMKISPEIYAGLNYEYHSTGSRLGYRDYSGSYSFDQIISANSIALEAEQSFTPYAKLALCLDMRAGVNFTNWNIKEEIIIGEQIEISSYELRGERVFLFPSLRITYPFKKRICISSTVGYLQELFGIYKFNNSNGSKSDLAAKFSGPRASISFEFSF